MIEVRELERIQKTFQTTLDNVIREYAQHLFLSRFYKNKGSENILFKGGTALRFAYKSPRFSEDLDFSAAYYLGQKKIEKLVLDTLFDLTNLGIKCDIEESKATTGGYLANLFTTIHENIVTVSLQVSFREKAKLNPQTLAIANEYIPTYVANFLEKNKMVEEKIEAALSRGKPRDFFDIYFLLRENLISPKLRSKLGEIKEILQSEDVQFKGDLSLFLPQSMRQVVKTFPKPLLTEIERFL